jgi:chromosome partitioning protein
MYTIAVLNQKGGTGKTTIATNLAAAAHLEKRRTLLVDLDRQGSSLDWSAARKEGSKLEGLAVVQAARALDLRRFREMGASYDVVLLDGPARLGDVTQSAAIAADVVVVPLGASSIDSWAAAETLAELDKADSLRGEIGKPPSRRIFVLNRAIVGTTLAREAPESLAKHELGGTVHQRIAITEASGLGESVLTTEKDGQAADEIRQLWRKLRPKGRAS